MKYLVLFVLTCLLPTLTHASPEKGPRADAHAPIGVMGDHLHHPQELMVSYRYMQMDMGTNKSGHSDVSTAEILNSYAVAPKSMTMQMHMFGLMLAPTENVTVMAMLPYIQHEMTMQTSSTTFSTQSTGLGDISITPMFGFIDEPILKAHIQTGISFPTGKLDAKDDTPAGSDQELPYGMKLSSGTIDFKPGLTYNWHYPTHSVGSQVLGTIRLGKNSENYTLGNTLSWSTWVAKNISSNFSTSLRGTFLHYGNTIGSDADLNATMTPAADNTLRGGKRFDISLGFNWVCTNGAFLGNRLALELGLPIYHSVDGPQLVSDWWNTIGWQLTF